MRRDPQKAVLVLDAMVEFFDGGRRWTRQLLHDALGNRCLIGALRYVRQRQRIRGAGTEYYLRCAYLALLDDPSEVVTNQDLMDHNDSAASYNKVRLLIVDARAIAQAELDAVGERQRASKPAISAEEMQRRPAHVRTAIADDRIEGIATSAATLEICEAYIRGEIEAGDLVTAYRNRNEP